MAHNGLGFAKLRYSIPSAWRCTLKVRKNINCERYESRLTKNVAKIGRRVVNCQAGTEEK